MSGDIKNLSIVDLLAEVDRRRVEDRPAAVKRLSDINKEIDALVTEATSLCEAYQLDFSYNDGDVEIGIDRRPGWNSSNYRC